MKETTRRLRWLSLTTAVSAIGLSTAALTAPMATVDRYGAFVSVEPYAANIVRVTIATDESLSAGKPGYGVSAHADATGWTHSTDASGDVFSSSKLNVTVATGPQPTPPTQMQRYFAPALPARPSSSRARTASRSSP